MHLLGIQNVSNDYVVCIHGRANASDRSFDAIVFGDLVRPDEVTAVLLDREEIAGPIGEVNCVTIHGRSCRDIAPRCEHPFGFQFFYIGWANGVFGGLAPSIV